jgi:hypothetical protein
VTRASGSMAVLGAGWAHRAIPLPTPFGPALPGRATKHPGERKETPGWTKAKVGLCMWANGWPAARIDEGGGGLAHGLWMGGPSIGRMSANHCAGFGDEWDQRLGGAMAIGPSPKPSGANRVSLATRHSMASSARRRGLTLADSRPWLPVRRLGDDIC